MAQILGIRRTTVTMLVRAMQVLFRVPVTEVHDEDEELVAKSASPELIGTIQGWSTR